MKIGILVPTLDTSQAGLCIVLNLNALRDACNDISTTVFIQDYGKLMVEPKFPIMQVREAWGFKGVLIATNLETARILDYIPGPSQKLLYLWQLEWMLCDETYQQMSELYQNDTIELIARSTSYADLISQLWKKPIEIMENFDYEKLIRIATRYG